MRCDAIRNQSDRQQLETHDKTNQDNTTAIQNDIALQRIHLRI